MVDLFWDEENGGFYLTSNTKNLIIRTKSPYDSATPSGNSEAVHVLLELARITGEKKSLEKARRTMRAFAGSMQQARMLLAVQHYLHSEPQKVTEGERETDSAASAAQKTNTLDLATLLSGLSLAKESGEPLLTDSSDLVQTEPFISVDRLVPGETFQVAVRLKVDDGWHINANPASFDFLIPTTLEVNADLPVKVLSIDCPPSTEFRSAFVEESISVYAGDAVIRATLRLGGKAPTLASQGRLELKLHYQACDESRCLAPAEVTLSVKVAVARDGEKPTRLHPDVFGAVFSDIEQGPVVEVEPRPASAQLDRLAPALAVQEWARGRPTTLDALKGKVVLLDLFQIICPGCRAAHPHIVRMQKEYEDEGFEVLGMAVAFEYEWAQTPLLIRGYVDAMAFPYPVAIDEGLIETFRRYRAQGTPYTALIDRNGRIRYLDFFRLDRVEPLLQQLLAEEGRA